MRAKRYNKGKIRFGLIPNEALKDLAEVYTKGAHKYTTYKDESGNAILGKDIPFEESSRYEIIEDGANDWRKGQDWLSVLESVERHISDFKNGKDFDEELKTKNLANAAWGLFSILSYYKIYPQGDNRHHEYLKTPRIGVDMMIL